MILAGLLLVLKARVPERTLDLACLFGAVAGSDRRQHSRQRILRRLRDRAGVGARRAAWSSCAPRAWRARPWPSGSRRGPNSFLATIQIAITLVGTLASAVGGRGGGGSPHPVARGPGHPRPRSVGRPPSPSAWSSSPSRTCPCCSASSFPRPSRSGIPSAWPAWWRARSRGSGACRRGRCRVLTVSTNAILRLHRTRPGRRVALRVGGGGALPRQRGRLPGHLREDRGRAGPQRLRVRRPDGARDHGAARGDPGARASTRRPTRSCARPRPSGTRASRSTAAPSRSRSGW